MSLRPGHQGAVPGNPLSPADSAAGWQPDEARSQPGRHPSNTRFGLPLTTPLSG